jgi:hypothetical protein
VTAGRTVAMRNAVLTGGAAYINIGAAGDTSYHYVRLIDNGNTSFYYGIDDSTGSFFGNGAYSRALYSEGSYPIGVYVGGAKKAEFTTAGNIAITNSGNGIDFSATPGTGTSELLADYEEGTWTPGISFGGASVGVTFTGTSGFYTKVGNVVTVSCYANMSSKGTSVGAARITALPFTCANSTAAYAATAILFTNITFLGQVSGYVNINDNTIDLFQTTELGVASALTNTNFANNTSIIINLTYRTA